MALRCKADKLVYTNLTWFLATNVSKSEQDAPIQPCHSMTLQPITQSQAALPSQQGTNITLELMLPNASFQDEGLYACQVVNIKTGVKTCLLRRLTLRGPCLTARLQTCRVLQKSNISFCMTSDLMAARIRNNFTDQKVNVSATITLHCDAFGTPNPTVVWTKNNNTVVEGSGGLCSDLFLLLRFTNLFHKSSVAFRCDFEPEQPDDSACETTGQRPVHLHRLQRPRLLHLTGRPDC